MPTYVDTEAGGTRDTAHHAWHNMLRTLYVDAPKELRRSYKAREAIRRLRHRHGLR